MVIRTRAVTQGDASGASLAESAESTEQILLAVAKEWADSLVANDAARVRGFVTDDWVIVSDSGIIPGSRLIDLIASGELTHSAMTVVGETRVRILGNTAVLTARITNTASYRGEPTDADEWTTDVFVRTDGRWLCALTHYTAATE